MTADAYLEHLVEDVRVREITFGSGYAITRPQAGLLAALAAW